MPNIAIVVLDTLRKDTFDEHFGWLPGRRYERAYSTSNWTVPAHASLFTGRYASEVAVHAKDTYLDCERPVLAEQLSAAGYTTRAFSANTNISGHFEFDRGFDQFLSPTRQRHLNDDDLFDWRAFNRDSTQAGVGRYLDAVRQCVTDDCRTLPSLLAGLRIKLRDEENAYRGTAEATERFREISFGDDEFLFVNVMEMHEPYRAPESYRTVKEPDLTNSVGNLSLGTVDGPQTRAAYEDCARYLADTYRDLFHLLVENFEYVITLSDHGELLGEHDGWGHEHGLYPELTHVPLVVSGGDLNGTCTAPVSLLDVHQTVLDIVGVEAEDSRGQSLLGEVEGQDYLTEYHGLTPWSERKLKQNCDADELSAYDANRRGCLTDTGYGYETIGDVVTVGDLSVDEARERIETLTDSLVVEETVSDSDDNDVPDEVQSRLEDLGYA
jgi:arylsulfatase